MAKDALERLYDSNSQEESTYSLEEQMDSADSNEDFLEGMSHEAESALFNSVTEITLDEPEQEEPLPINLDSDESDQEDDKDLIVCDPNIIGQSEKEANMTHEELFNNNKVVSGSRRGRKPKNQNIQTKEMAIVNSTNSSTLSPIVDQIAKDIIDDLRKSKYKINRFDDKTMKLVFDYMYEKF